MDVAVGLGAVMTLPTPLALRVEEGPGASRRDTALLPSPAPAAPLHPLGHGGEQRIQVDLVTEE